jgi:hypothetical protein
MLRLSCLTLVLAAACTVTKPAPTPAPACTSSYTLAPASQSISISSLAVDSGGTLVCLDLDATQMQHTHFAATTDYRDGASARIHTTLVDMQGNTIVDGWDVTVGSASPRSMENLEWDPPAGTITQVQLVVESVGDRDTTELDLALFDPHE